jgi:hypothetical protein
MRSRQRPWQWGGGSSWLIVLALAGSGGLACAPVRPEQRAILADRIM